MLKISLTDSDTLPSPPEHTLAHMLQLFSGYTGNLKMNDFSEFFHVWISSIAFSF
jgi:hypothetical protein